MRGRHFPRLCRSCDAPMARQQDFCWSCGAAWTERSGDPAPAQPAPSVTHNGEAAGPGGDQPPAPVVIGKAAVAHASPDVDRWADEGGSVADEKSRRISVQIAEVH
jgi:hypothetical protein